jgi:hypothetical protein
MSQRASNSANRRPEFVTLIAIYQFVTAGILFLLSCMIPAVLFPAIVFYVNASEGVFSGFALATAALAMFIGFGVASVIVGWGLLRMREWGRLGAIVLGAFALIGFPIWTVVAILVLVYLTSDEARRAFAEQRQPAGDPRYHDALAAKAAYKADPSPSTGASPLDETRQMRSMSFVQERGGERVANLPEAHESHEIRPIPMPAPEAENSSAQPGAATNEVTQQEPPTRPKRRWARPPEEAAMDDRIIRPRENEP